MVSISIQDNFPDVMRQLDQLQADVGHQALVRAVNRTLDLGKTRMIRTITGEYAIKAGVVRDSLRVKGASRKAGRFEVQGFLESPSKKGRSRNLIHFSARQTKQGVSVRVRRDSPRKVIPGAFIALKGNATGGTVFIREGKSRLPIKALQTIDVAQMFNARKVKKVVVEVMQERFPDVFAREARFYLDRFNARMGR